MAMLLCIFLFLASMADSQMNRDSPLLGSKLPRTDDQNFAGQSRQTVSPIVISAPFNDQAVSDLSLSADPNNTTCDAVSFLITLTPSSSSSAGYQPVKIRLLENRMGSPTAVAELTLLMPVTGGTLREIIGFSSAASSAGPSGANEITVVADPDNQITETDEGNNVINISGTC